MKKKDDDKYIGNWKVTLRISKWKESENDFVVEIVERYFMLEWAAVEYYDKWKYKCIAKIENPKLELLRKKAYR